LSSAIWAEEFEEPAVDDAYVRSYNSERERLAGDAGCCTRPAGGERGWIEGERQRNVISVISTLISEEDIAGFDATKRL